MPRFGSIVTLLAIALSLAPVLGHAADLSPNEVGAYLQAGARLKEALVGRLVVTRQALPARSTGLVVAMEQPEPPDPKALEKTVRSLGKACDAGDTLVIDDVRVSHREIAIVFGSGGYREEDAVAFAPLQPGFGEILARWRVTGARTGYAIQVHNTATGQVTIYDAPRSRAALEVAEGAAREAARGRELSELTRIQERRRTLSKTWGARIRLVARRDLALEGLEPGTVRERLASCLQFVD